ncbi:hypothetical protein [Streptomyces flavidovirens]|uniref:hypothetical protein n=1 Tax=Streptomyces flavidovirens TaxID=67298 RepID=UPI0036D05255
MAPLYRLLFADLVTDQLLDVLPVQGLGFDDYIGKSGALSGKIPIPDPEMAARVRAAAVPGRTAVWVERGSDIWWGGILWTMTPSVDDRGGVSVDIQAATFESYLDRRVVFTTQTYTQVDQLAIARGLVGYAASLSGGDIGIRMDATKVSGVLRDRSYVASEVPRVRDLLDDLAAVDGGFEWRIQAYRDTATGARVKQLQLGYPKIAVGAQPVMLTYPGNVLAYTLPSDATTMANVWQSRGATVDNTVDAEGGPLLSSVWRYDDRLNGGWPRLDGTSDYNTVSVKTTLDNHAKADLARARNAATIPSIRVRLDGEITPALIGARARLRIRDVWHAEGLDATYRVVGMKLDPAERGREESAELYLEAA